MRHILLTVKCLLIVPNPESALNEEAGKLLLEHYDDYCARAKLYTDIHAKPSESSTSSTKTLSNSSVASSNIQHNSEKSSSENSEHSANKKACNGVNGHESNAIKKATSKKDKIIKDKKKTLKRLWSVRILTSQYHVSYIVNSEEYNIINYQGVQCKIAYTSLGDEAKSLTTIDLPWKRVCGYAKYKLTLVCWVSYYLKIKIIHVYFELSFYDKDSFCKQRKRVTCWI